MGGCAGAESTPGQGSVFWFTVRLKPGDEAAVQNKAAGTPVPAARRIQESFSGARLLVADDDPMNQEVARALLEEIGCVVDLAANGQEAMEKVFSNDYALVLMDMQMPVLDGLEATRRIRASGRKPGVPILAMTANVFAEDRERCLAAGMNDFISKPFVPEKLLETLLAWLSAR